MKSKKELKQGECIAVVKNEITGKTKNIDASYDSKLNVVFCCYSEHENIIGYIQ